MSTPRPPAAPLHRTHRVNRIRLVGRVISAVRDSATNPATTWPTTAATTAERFTWIADQLANPAVVDATRTCITVMHQAVYGTPVTITDDTLPYVIDGLRAAAAAAAHPVVDPFEGLYQ